MRAESFTVTNAISFHGSDDCLTDLHLEASGFCLIHADNPLSRTQGVFVNPHVRVGYGQKAYNAVDSGDDTDSYPKVRGNLQRSAEQRIGAVVHKPCLQGVGRGPTAQRGGLTSTGILSQVGCVL
jgi:hypothetical protein